MSMVKTMRILMADGSMKEIADVIIGDAILNDQYASVIVREVYCGREDVICCVKLNDGSVLRVTAEQPVLTENGFSRVAELEVGNLILGAKAPQTVLQIMKEEYGDMVFNLLLDSQSHSIICEGVIVGDFCAQETCA